MRLVIALGGNALLRRGEPPDAEIQLAHVRRAAPALAEVAAQHDLILTHGNGPQVGLLARESGDDRALSGAYPLDSLVAETQGLIGYWLQQSIASAGLAGPIVSLVTQTIVAADDASLTDPTKFVGSLYDEEHARALSAGGWEMRPDGPAWRRVVPSPLPLRVVEAPIIEALSRQGTTVICAGGGGAPVVSEGGALRGIEAVIDKDHVASLLALELGADELVLLTDVAGVISNYGTPEARALGEVTVDDLGAEQFAAGSMGPKVVAACRFVRETGRPATIGSLDDLASVIEGRSGTRIRR